METKIEYEPGDAVCTIRVTGEIQRPVDSDRLQAICFAHGDETGCSKYLFDMRVATVLGSNDGFYEAAVGPGEKGVDPSKYHTALVYDELLSEHRLMQIVLNQHGYDVAVFDNIGLALEWLHSR
jgi:hypothetical protein